MKTPETLIHGMVGANRCPICDREYSDKRSLQVHMLNTRKHRTIIHELWRLRLLLEEAERDLKIIRGQRNEWRRIAQGCQ